MSIYTEIASSKLILPVPIQDKFMIKAELYLFMNKLQSKICTP